MTPSHPITHLAPRQSQKPPPLKTWELCLTPDAVSSALLVGCCYIWTDPSRPLAPVLFSPCTNISSGHILNMRLKPPAPTYPVTQRHWKRCERASFHVLYEAALHQLRLFSLTHWWVRGDLISMFKITHSNAYSDAFRQGLRALSLSFCRYGPAAKNLSREHNLSDSHSCLRNYHLTLS